MEIYKIIGVAIITCIIVIVLRQTKPEFATLLALAGGMIIILMTVDYLTATVSSFSTLAEKSGLPKGLFKTVLKIVGIGYLTEFSSNLCADSNCQSLADKVLLGGKIIILTVAMPIVSNILEILVELVP